MGGKMNLSTATTESRWLGLKLLCIAVLAVIRWLEHVRHVRDIGINRIIWIWYIGFVGIFISRLEIDILISFPIIRF